MSNNNLNSNSDDEEAIQTQSIPKRDSTCKKPFMNKLCLDILNKSTEKENNSEKDNYIDIEEELETYNDLKNEKNPLYKLNINNRNRRFTLTDVISEYKEENLIELQKIMSFSMISSVFFVLVRVI